METVGQTVETIKPRVSQNKDRYERVNKAWPEVVPPLTQKEAITATKLLWRIVTKRTWGKRSIKFTSGNRYTTFKRGGLRVNLAHRGNASEGWKDLVHVLSHRAHYEVNKGHPGHGTAHASLENWMITEVVNHGWLQGKLKKEEPEKPEIDVKAKRHMAVLSRIKAWESKAKRAETALKKLRRQKSYYERTIN